VHRTEDSVVILAAGHECAHNFDRDGRRKGTHHASNVFHLDIDGVQMIRALRWVMACQLIVRAGATIFA
jgi:hypothetical protein